MIIPLTPIRDAWGGVEPAEQQPVSSTPQTPSQRSPVIGYSPSTAFDTYKLPEDYVPNAMDVTVYDRDVINSLMPMTSNKRSDLVTEVLRVFFGDSTNNKPDLPKDRVEYFRGYPQNNNNDVDSVHLIIMVLLTYILIDKLTTIWART
tara:strand:+ start:867 stop:1310 length:444 start_codon:yes stop_codon:yes gene_type:complete